MKERRLTIGKAILLVFAPTLMSLFLYIGYRFIFNGQSVASFSYTATRIFEYAHDFFRALIIWYGFKKYHFSFHWREKSLNSHKFSMVFLLSVFFFFISSFLYNAKFFFTNDILESSEHWSLGEVCDYAIGSLMIAPITEELLLKNILDKLKRKYSILLSLFFVSFLFTITHFQGYHWYTIPNYFFFSVISCIVFLKTESISLCIFMHFLQNLFIGISIPYDSFLYEKIYTQQWYLLILIFAGFGIIKLLSALKK